MFMHRFVCSIYLDRDVWLTLGSGRKCALRQRNEHVIYFVDWVCNTRPSVEGCQERIDIDLEESERLQNLGQKLG